MPTAKRLKGTGVGAVTAGRPSESVPVVEPDRPTPAEVEGEEHQFVQLARKNWLKLGNKPPKVKNDVLKQGVWSVLEQDGFSYRLLLLLESLQILESEKLREGLLDQNPQLRKTWRASQRRFDAADDSVKARLRFDRSWLYSMLLDFLNMLQDSKIPVYNDEDNSLLRDLHALLSHYTYFAIDDQTGIQLTATEVYDKHCAALGRLQRVALKHFKDKLLILALSNYGGIEKRDDLESLLEPLTGEELSQLFHLLNIRSTYPECPSLPIDRKLLTEILLHRYERKKSFRDTARYMPLLPTERSLFDTGFQRADSYDGSRPLALPKLNLQYLSCGDFLLRAMILYRCEAFYGIRKDVEAALRRLRPESNQSGVTNFAGFSKMALPISKPSILEVMPPLVGEDLPSMVRAEISIDVRRLGPNVMREWDSLRPDDVVFLLAIQPPPTQPPVNDGGVRPEYEKLGISSIRAAEILLITDEKGRHVRDGSMHLDSKRRITVKLDPYMYSRDTERSAAAKPGVYDQMNLLLRRGRRENNFKHILESIRKPALSETPLPSWLHEVFLGYGDPAGANYNNLSHRVRRLDYRDTFLDWQHLVESLPGKTVDPGDDVAGSFGPPYVLEEVEDDSKGDEHNVGQVSKKRRRGAEPTTKSEVTSLKVSTYEPPNNGPYPSDAPKENSVRFTPAQVEAIMSGSQPGLTVIVGPPGTGKTDVATQIINNIYHNFPHEKTLLLAHSNQALNQLFAKIIALDIDHRHLLRLGHGEDDLDAEGSFGKHGRVESFLDNRQKLLQEVRKLAVSLGAPGAHDNSAETAGYFNKVYVEPAWQRFENVVASAETSTAEAVKAFPFYEYFADAPQPLFPEGCNRDEAVKIANGCYRHISKIFSELADIVPFEILRRDREKANYLLTSEARIVAMTTTHAAIRRGEIASLGFRYENVVMEEAAQITELETFLPLAMQKPVGKEMPLKRVVLCGDHFQNSPIIQSLAFRHFANLEQSLFSRLIRLGVPAIILDQQGRARPSIAKLYQWRYPKLENLPHVQNEPEFVRANAGFKYDYQFISVPSYKGRGESEPTPHFIQNLGEAEYAVAIYQYMRLLGYPAERISILTTYAGQRALVKDVLAYRCGRNPIFGLPKAVATVDKYQGEQNDCYLRDVRRMTVAVSRARLGLYVLGRREVFEACPELRPAFDLLLERSDKLMLVTGEMWPTERRDVEGSTAVEGEVAMESVEHLGQYVFEMTNTKVKREQGQEAEREMELLETIPEGVDEEEAQTTHYEYDEEAVEPDILEVREGESKN
ncbi:hypothetical protein UVI_02047820 [Ustilaginoidea virens]|uniref:Pre-mRNA-splicing factor n=1 Tax=Ustilaginoidea virens TaxID=1159556 RepID=A0A1B5KZF1_USTVR|nr:hypothetical protein UVI_02047820 [Ustilaginoidea virens]